MSDSTPSPFSTPKRKRDDTTLDRPLPPLNTDFCFDVNASVAADLNLNPPASGSSSPRSKVAHRFRGLKLADRTVPNSNGNGNGNAASGSGSGDGVPAAPQRPAASAVITDDSMQVDEDESMMRKRNRISQPALIADGESTGAPLPLQPQNSHTPNNGDNQRCVPVSADLTDFRLAPSHGDAPAALQPQQPFVIDQQLFTSSPKPSPAKIARLSFANGHPAEPSKAKSRRRMGTPPPPGIRATENNASQSNTNTEITDAVDTVRANLTWHEDEITVYDPEDEDDDGVGINGIGFKPTPAIAYARTMKRKQQLAEYRKREEREARARRSHRRRGSPEKLDAAKIIQKDSGSRKVRFTEAESNMMIGIV